MRPCRLNNSHWICILGSTRPIDCWIKWILWWFSDSGKFSEYLIFSGILCRIIFECETSLWWRCWWPRWIWCAWYLVSFDLPISTISKKNSDQYQNHYLKIISNVPRCQYEHVRVYLQFRRDQKPMKFFQENWYILKPNLIKKLYLVGNIWFKPFAV